MSRWSWSRVEYGGQLPVRAYSVLRDERPVAHMEIDRTFDPTAALNAFCAALTGQGSATPPPNPVPAADTRPLTAAQRGAIHAGFNELGYARDARLAAISTFLGRAVATSNDLTRDEASLIIDRLAQRLAAKRRSTAA